ncbi:MAG: hypothetical protein RBR09_11360 [Desulfobulbaceae bacterium]|jgi:hypothetical protein|nr:hypothetical protein [Desulfobulbaceae bacterium]MDY0351842.1 hypothetical protein [Desulfobulbaceae bacterium]
MKRTTAIFTAALFLATARGALAQSGNTQQIRNTNQVQTREKTQQQNQLQIHAKKQTKAQNQYQETAVQGLCDVLTPEEE